MESLIVWIIDNHQWFFSGLGVFLIGFFVVQRKTSNKVSTKGHISPGNVKGDFKVTINVEKNSRKN